MKNVSLILTLFLLSNLALAQNGKITGTVKDNYQAPLFGVNISLKNTTKGTQTDDNGAFEILNITNDNQTLVISYLGFKTREIEISVANNETKDIGTIILFEGNELLQEIIVVGERANKFSRKETAYVGKMPLKDMENATVYSTVTTEILESQVVTNLDDALNNATGVFKLWESTNRDARGTGYFSSRGFATQPQLVDGMPGYVFSNVDPSYIERIEVIKGPNATLFGSTVTSLGGLMNVVTKKPYKGFGGEVSYTIGSFDLHRVTADVNTPISKKEDIYFRLNSSYLTQNSFQDAGFKKHFLLLHHSHIV